MYRILKDYDGVFIVGDRGMVCKMMAGYGQTQVDDAKKIISYLNMETHKDV